MVRKYRSSTRDLAVIVGVALTTVFISGCGRVPVPSGTDQIATVDPSATHMLIVGVDEDHVAITEPFVEVIPPAEEDDAEVDIAFRWPAQPVILGIEGAVAFLRAHAPDGSVVWDSTVSFDGDTVRIPAGEHTLVVYYRTCDGNCSVLDPPHTFCTPVVSLDRGGRYELDVGVADQDIAECTVTRSP